MQCLLSAIDSKTGRTTAIKGCLLASAALLLPAQAVFAQEADPEPDPDAIVVIGDIARTIENSLETKRDLDVIGDALVGEDIGDLPDLSIAETLERIVGVTSDRFKGGSSELSVRGLGAFLGASFINGREITSGSDGRDINFGQFPSELINGAIVYKSQQANFIEGGVSGLIELQTLRPVDYGRQRLQIQGLLGYSDYEGRVVDGDPLSQRLTASYVGQWDVGAGEFGIALGGQIRRDTAPEDLYTSSSTYSVCNSDRSLDGGNNCSFDPDNSGPQYFTSNQYIFRALETEADRDAIMGAIQYKTDTIDINIDAQYSDRFDREDRQNLIISDGRRRITPLEVSDQGALLFFEGNSRVELNPFRQDQSEEYIGVGANVEFEVSDRFILALDAGYSQTERRRDELDIRIRTQDRVDFSLDFRGFDVPALEFLDVSPVENRVDEPFDLNNFDQYTSALRVRRRQENVDDDLLSFRVDGQYDFDGALSSIRVGVRFADRQRVRDDGIDRSSSDATDPIVLVNDIFSDEAVAARQAFPVENFYEGANTPAQGLSFASWNPELLFLALTGDADAGLPLGSTLSTDDTDVTERSWAGYTQANFDTELFGVPARADIGVRVIRTDITSLGVSQDLVTSPGGDAGEINIQGVGSATVNTETNDFWNVLPSANLSLELHSDVLLRLAAYRAIARPDPEAMSAALDIDNQSNAGSVGEAVSASGNPFLEPLQSWNGDVSVEWYAADTTSLSVAGYYKSLQTGFDTDVSSVTLIVDGAPTNVQIARTVNSDDASRIFGVEVNAQHQFDFGFGVQLSYNFADSDFEFPDPTIGTNGNALADFTVPANLPGYSRHTFNGTVFYETGPFSARVAYKWRSEYFRPFRSTSNRFTGDQGFLDFSASYNLNRNVQLRVQALNILDEANRDFRPTSDSVSGASFSGTRYFLGLRGRF